LASQSQTFFFGSLNSDKERFVSVLICLRVALVNAFFPPSAAIEFRNAKIVHDVEQIESIRKVSVVTTTRRSIFSFSFCSGNKTKKQNKTRKNKTR